MKLIKLKSEDISTVQQLAREIWEEHYLPIIGQQQIDYMLDLFYSTEKIQKELEDGVYWEILYLENEPIGYLVCEVEKENIQLSKLYLKSKVRGRGLGKFLIDRAIEIAKENNKNSIRLNVNKNNTQSIAFYERVGFLKVEEGVFDIGNGYFMDDFIYEMKT